MQSARLAAGGLLCAVLGGVAALGIAKAAGWLGRETKETVVVTEPSGTRAGSAVDLPRIRPLVGNAFDPARIYELRSPGVVTIFSMLAGGETAQGSGFVVSPDGYLLTSSHVITDAGLGQPAQRPHVARRVYVEFADRDRVLAKVVGFDVFDDVGVLRVDPTQHRLSPVPLGESSAVRVGEPVAAIGSPFGNENSLAVGVVSATRRSIDSLTSPYDLPDAIQVDAPINHGDSGGPVFDARGSVIGIAAQIRSTTGSGEGVGFAVPIDAARRSMRELIESGSVSYAYVGIVTEDLTPSVARHFRLKVARGALIDSVRRGGAGARAGLRAGNRDVNLSGERIHLGGDVIVAIDGRSVTDSEDVLRIVTEGLRPGKAATFTVVRGGARLSLRVVPGERPENPN
jgi:S1-C subfamily serine protease